MGQILIRNLPDDLIADYREAATRNQRSLEAELRVVLAERRPLRKKSAAELRRMSDEALAMTPPDGPGIGSDSTLHIRWDRDTNHGKWLEEGWSDGNADR